MRSGRRLQIDQQFVEELTSHPAFIAQLSKINKVNECLPPPPPSIPSLVDQITSLLLLNYRQSVDEQGLSFYRTCSQLTQEIEELKNRIAACEMAKTDCSGMERDRPPQLSLFSEVSLVPNDSQPATGNPEERQGPEQGSFIGSLLADTNCRDFREQLEEKLRSSAVHLFQVMDKVQTDWGDRLKALELSTNRKFESIFKTLSNLFENISELQNKVAPVGDPQNKGGLGSNRQSSARTKLQDLLESKGIPNNDKAPPAKQKSQKEPPRRRSFLGINY